MAYSPNWVELNSERPWLYIVHIVHILHIPGYVENFEKYLPGSLEGFRG